MDIKDALRMVQKEVESTTTRFGQFNSTHEGYASIKEELDGLWDAIKRRDTGLDAFKHEAIHLTAMSLCFLLDFCTYTERDRLLEQLKDAQSKFQSIPCQCGGNVSLWMYMDGMKPRTRIIQPGVEVSINRDIHLPSCSTCGEIYWTPEITEPLDKLLKIDLETEDESVASVFHDKEVKSNLNR